MEEIIKKNQPVDMVTLTDALERAGTLEQAGGIGYIAELTNVMPSSANYYRYLDIVTRDSLLRKLIKGSASIIEECQIDQLNIREMYWIDKLDSYKNGYNLTIGGGNTESFSKSIIQFDCAGNELDRYSSISESSLIT